MATWADFEAAEPEMAIAARRLWPGITALDRGEAKPRDGGHWFSIAYLATTRRDGSARLHPFCPILAAGRLFAAIPASSPKGRDLRRDPRCVIHALPGPDDAELCLRARAYERSAEAVLRAAVVDRVRRTAVGGMIETTKNDPLFELELEQVDVATWVERREARNPRGAPTLESNRRLSRRASKFGCGGGGTRATVKACAP